MGIKVVKFGGSSLCDAEHFKKVREIVLDDPARCYVVPSAPGKRFDGDEKVTDLLYRCYRMVELNQSHEEVFARIADRYLSIVEELGIDFDMRPILSETCDAIRRRRSVDFAASRGEYLCGIVLAKYLGWDFIDPVDVIKFDRRGAFAAEWTNEMLMRAMEDHPRAVIPGFYGSYPNGDVHTFSRGGSDVSGAIVARAAEADVYENWTDVNGFLMADPRVVDNPRTIRQLTYRELRELSYMGATVLHEEAIFPVHKAGIPTNIRNTNNPEDPGTLIVAQPTEESFATPITGIAGHKDFTLITIDKAMMNAEYGFGRRVLQALEDFDVSFEHLPTGIDTMCVIVSDRELSTRKDQIIQRIRQTCQPDSIEIQSGLALIATVGYGMVRRRGTAAKLFKALYEADVNVRMIDQGSSELNIIVGVDTADFETAMRAIYHAFVGA
ncbi:MAG TPA: aspartate kinase [Candidatus Faecivicinus avistercoris]|nr:aspartate kinase [Candidatus Faecivicinus avistercoris]